MRVFILEDSNSRIILFREIFQDLSIDLFITDDVVEAALEFKGNYDLVLLDHDLSEEHQREVTYGEVPKTLVGTGSEFASWLAESASPTQGPVVIHSYNPAGAERMFQSLKKKGWDVYKQPFGLTLLDKLKLLVKNSLSK